MQALNRWKCQDQEAQKTQHDNGYEGTETQQRDISSGLKGMIWGGGLLEIKNIYLEFRQGWAR